MYDENYTGKGYILRYKFYSSCVPIIILLVFLLYSCEGKKKAIPPSPPEELVATGISATQIKLIWSPSKGNVRVKGYNVYNSLGEKIAFTFDNYLVVSFLLPSTTYCFRVSAVDIDGNESSPSEKACGRTMSVRMVCPNG